MLKIVFNSQPHSSACPARARDFRQKAEGSLKHCKDDNSKVVGDREGHQDTRGKSGRADTRKGRNKANQASSELSPGPKDWESL